MQAIFFLDQIMVHIVGTETGPESINTSRIERMPERRVELLPSLEEVEDIEKPIIFIDL